jgi:membrane-associated phospholipid phosphatase
MLKWILAAALAGVLALSPAVARADGELRYDVRVDIPLTAGLLWAWIVSEQFQRDLAPQHCRWCERDASGRSTVNPLDAGARDLLRVSNTKAAESAGNAIGYGVGPLLVLASAGVAATVAKRQRDFAVDALLIAESAAIAVSINQLVKYSVGRERPYYHYGQDTTATDRDVSFFSGHTTLMFSLSVSAGTIASMRHYRLAPLVWSLGLALSLTTGYLRIAADRHYFTDVLTGAAVGSLVGFLDPFVAHRRWGRFSPSLRAVTGGAVLALAAPW